MGFFAKLLELEADLRRAGFSFLIGGLRAELSRASTVSVRLPNARYVSVRPRQSDFDTLRQVIRDRDYRLPQSVVERVEQEYERICATGMVPVVIDAGANIGAATVWFKSQFPKAAVVAIEPDPGNAALARSNVAHLQDVTVIEAGLGGKPGFISLIASDKGWSVKTERSAAGCQVVTIDQAIETVPSGELFIVKVDIEGFERDLFEGDLGWLENVMVVFIEPHDWLMPGKRSSRSFQAVFGERDFEIFVSGENLIYVRRDSPGLQNQLV